MDHSHVPSVAAELAISMTTDRCRTDRRHICVTGLRGIPGVQGGVESHCEELLPRIAELAPDLQIEVLARRPYVGAARRCFHKVRITPLFSTKRQSTEAVLSTFLGLAYARSHQADLIHVHAVGKALIAPFARALRTPIVFTHHGEDYAWSSWGTLAKSVLRIGERLGVTAANATIAVAPWLAESLRQRYPSHAHKIHYIPNGKPVFGPRRPADKLLQTLGVQAGEYILAVGRLVPEKNFDRLIAAVELSRTTRKLLIVGASNHHTRYAVDLLKRASSKIVFAGSQPRDILQQLYENASLFVLPSVHEGLPISALEAGALGCPMLLSDIPPNRDLRLPDKNYFGAEDVEGLAHQLTREPRNFSVDPAHFDQFDWDRIAAETLTVYRSVLASGPLEHRLPGAAAIR